VLRLILGALVVAGLIGTAAPRPASAASTQTQTPLQLVATQLTANHTTGEWGKDEPYLVLFAADLSNPNGRGVTKHTGTFKMNAKGQNTAYPNVQVWSISGSKAPITDTNDVLVLAALMENDSDDPAVIANNVDSRVQSMLAAYHTLSYTSLVSKLRTEMDNAIGQARKHDEQIGLTQSVSVTSGNVVDASHGVKVSLFPLRFTGHNANYELTFTLSS
jgi:hypothetical protein